MSPAHSRLERLLPQPLTQLLRGPQRPSGQVQAGLLSEETRPPGVSWREGCDSTADSTPASRTAHKQVAIVLCSCIQVTEGPSAPGVQGGTHKG